MSISIGDLIGKISLEDNFTKPLQESGKAMSQIGRQLLPLSAAFSAFGAVAFKASMDINRSMANVATLIPGASQRVRELKDDVQKLAITTGKSSSDIAGGLYQVISAYGDTADSVKMLEINAKAGAAGLATTLDAINLTSAVTKGYGTVSAEATQKAADLAFMTVKLGQTTFPELAASMGAVIPIGSALKVSQEELFAGFATLTGVTGNAAEVSTQLKSSMSALMKPTDAMTEAIHKLGYSGSEALISDKGLVGAMRAVIETTDGSTEAVGELFNNIRSLPAVFALTGGQADTFNQKLKEMSNASGAMSEAFKAQTEGIGKAAFTWDQFKERLSQTAAAFGDQLAPAFMKAMDLAAPVLEWLAKLAQGFSDLPEPVQYLVLGLGGVISAAGPFLIVIGQLQIGLAALGTTIGGVTTAVAPWVIAIGAGAAIGWKLGSAIDELTHKNTLLSKTLRIVSGVWAYDYAAGVIMGARSLEEANKAAVQVSSDKMLSNWTQDQVKWMKEWRENIDKTTESILKQQSVTTAAYDLGTKAGQTLLQVAKDYLAPIAEKTKRDNEAAEATRRAAVAQAEFKKEVAEAAAELQKSLSGADLKKELAAMSKAVADLGGHITKEGIKQVVDLTQKGLAEGFNIPDNLLKIAAENDMKTYMMNLWLAMQRMSSVATTSLAGMILPKPEDLQPFENAAGQLRDILQSTFSTDMFGNVHEELKVISEDTRVIVSDFEMQVALAREAAFQYKSGEAELKKQKEDHDKIREILEKEGFTTDQIEAALGKTADTTEKAKHKTQEWGEVMQGIQATFELLGISADSTLGQMTMGVEALANAMPNLQAAFENGFGGWDQSNANYAGAAQGVMGMIQTIQTQRSGFGRHFTASVQGANAGAQAGGPWGALAGGVIGTVASIFGGEPDWVKTAERVGRELGIELTQEMAQAISDTADQLNISVTQATVMAAATMARESGQEARSAMDSIMRLQEGVADGTLPLVQGTQALAEAWGNVTQEAELAGRVGDRMTRAMLDQQRALGELTPEMQAFVDDALAQAVRGVDGLVASMVTLTDEAAATEGQITYLGSGLNLGAGTQGMDLDAMQSLIEERADALGQIFSATFWAMVKEDGILAATDAMREPFARMIENLSADTFDQDTINQMFGQIGRLMDMTAPGTDEAIAGPFRAGLEAVTSLDDALVGLADSGYLSQQSVFAFGTGLETVMAQMADAGASQEEQIQAALPYLQDMVSAAEQYGYALDDNTLALVAQAEQMGYAFPDDPLYVMVDLLSEIVEVLGGTLPESAQTFSNSMTEASGSIEDNLAAQAIAAQEAADQTAASMQTAAATMQESMTSAATAVESQMTTSGELIAQAGDFIGIAWAGGIHELPIQVDNLLPDVERAFGDMEGVIEQHANGAASAVGAVVGQINAMNDAAANTQVPQLPGGGGGAPPPQYQHGGIVTGPTMALVGEVEPEAILPLDKLASLISGAPTGRAGGGSGHITQHLTIMLDGKMVYDGMYDASKDRRILIDAGAVI